MTKRYALDTNNTALVETPADRAGVSDPVIFLVAGRAAVAGVSSLIVLGERRRHRRAHGYKVAAQDITALTGSEPGRQHAVVDFSGDGEPVEGRRGQVQPRVRQPVRRAGD